MSSPLSGQHFPHSAGHDEGFFSQVLPWGPWGAWLVRYRVILPKNYDASRRHSVVYFLHGKVADRYYLEALGCCSQLDRLVDRGDTPLILVAPDGGNNYWMNAALKNERWSDVVAQELIADVEGKYPVVRHPSGRLLAGISMGGHGALQIQLNQPGIFGAIAAHSPVFYTQDETNQEQYYEFGTGLAFQERDPFSLILLRNRRLDVPVWVDMGGQDGGIENTRNFVQLLRNRGVPGEFHVDDDPMGGHHFQYWAHHLPRYLHWYSRQLIAPTQEHHEHVPAHSDHRLSQ